MMELHSSQNLKDTDATEKVLFDSPSNYTQGIV